MFVFSIEHTLSSCLNDHASWFVPTSIAYTYFAPFCIGVRTDVFGDAGLLRQFLDEMEYHDARDIFAPACQEYIVLPVQ